ncbi:MAG: transposase [Burkholderiales bacterium]|nr:transposase [Phycisphaerae bacterium]
MHRVLAEYPTGPIDLVWDNLNAHKSKLVKELLGDHPRLAFHFLPPYAPDLNAVEGIWCLTKHHRMANHGIDDLNLLHAEAQRHLHDLSQEQHLLQSCFKNARLALSQDSAQ